MVRFFKQNIAEIERLAEEFYQLLFEPEVVEPLKTLDVPLGGSVSPVDALALLIEFLVIAGSRDPKSKAVSEYADDASGDETIKVLGNALQIINRITGNSPASLGLHPAIYFYNERGKYNRFLFLGMTLLITDAIRNNDDAFFKRCTSARKRIEKFLTENKSLIGIFLQNMAKTQRVPKMRDLVTFLIKEFNSGKDVSAELAITHLGLRGRIIDVVNVQASPHFSDDTKAMIFIRKALEVALVCPICEGKLDPNKSVSYDHKTRVREGGTGDVSNGDLVHPYCNTGINN